MKKIVLIGDSTRQGYDRYTKMTFEGIAEVYYPQDNCRFAAYVLRYLLDWKNETGCGDDVDLVHWNAGLWDEIVLPDGKNHTPIPLYKEYLERICITIKKLFPNAKMMFATSVPVLEELYKGCELKRYNKDIELYNAAAIEIVTKYGAEINDLYALLKNAPVECHSDMTHYYTKEGTRLITGQVVNCIEKVLDIKGKVLDYDRVFAEKE